MVGREGAERIPQDLGIVVAVVVDEPGRHDAPIRLDDPPRRAVEASQLDDPTARHAHVSVERGPTGAIDDATVLDQEVVGHESPPSSGIVCRKITATRNSARAAARHSAVVPPSITNSLPVTYDDSSEAR